MMLVKKHQKQILLKVDDKGGEETPKTDTTKGGEQTGADRVLDAQR